MIKLVSYGHVITPLMRAIVFSVLLVLLINANIVRARDVDTRGKMIILFDCVGADGKSINLILNSKSGNQIILKYFGKSGRKINFSLPMNPKIAWSGTNQSGMLQLQFNLENGTQYIFYSNTIDKYRSTFFKLNSEDSDGYVVRKSGKNRISRCKNMYRSDISWLSPNLKFSEGDVISIF